MVAMAALPEVARGELPQPTPLRRAPFRTQFLYGFGDIGVALSSTAIGTYLMFFYTDVAGLGIFAAGIVKGIGRVWDAITDPAMGYLSDRTRSRLGRRRFWLIVSPIPLGLGIWAVFAPPVGLGTTGLFWWMLGTYLFVYLSFTAFLTPYYALGAELSEDVDERTRIVAIRTFFQYGGAIVGGFMPLLASLFGEGELRTGYAVVAAGFGVVAAGAILIAFFGTREPPPAPRQAASFANFWWGVRESFKNRPFRILLATFVVMSLGGGLNGAVSVYALIYWLGFSQAEVGIIIPVYLGAATLALPFWVWVSTRFGKDRALKALCFFEVVVLSAIYFLVPIKAVVYAFLTFAGFGLAGFLIASSLLADVLDHDELVTGDQRGGAFFGFWTFALKLANGLGPPIAGGLLGAAGYVAGQAQTPLVIETLRWLYGPIPAVFFLAAALIFWRFPLTREEHARIQDELIRRRQAGAPG
jgi:GPH family glycoside/pentoside/hexuronide:cation symporter